MHASPKFRTNYFLVPLYLCHDASLQLGRKGPSTTMSCETLLDLEKRQGTFHRYGQPNQGCAVAKPGCSEYRTRWMRNTPVLYFSNQDQLAVVRCVYPMFLDLRFWALLQRL